jgi:hypothetical protein
MYSLFIARSIMAAVMAVEAPLEELHEVVSLWANGARTRPR